jgi:thiol-disulfide isomerase/thioredoxin
MKKIVFIAIIVAAAGAGLYFAVAKHWLESGGGQHAGLGPVPISGSVQNFTVLDEPVPAPAIAFETATGETRTLNDLQGGLVLVNFWATFCGPCIRELPSIETLATEFSGKGLTVALMSQDHTGWETINSFLERLHIETPESFLDVRKKLAAAIGVSSLPVTALIDAEGSIVGVVSGPAEWDTPEAYDLIQHFLDQQDATG